MYTHARSNTHTRTRTHTHAHKAGVSTNKPKTHNVIEEQAHTRTHTDTHKGIYMFNLSWEQNLICIYCVTSEALEVICK